MAWADDEDLEDYLATAAGALRPEEIEAHRQALLAVRARGYSAHLYAGPRQALGERASRMVQEGVDDVEGALTDLVHDLVRHDYLPRDPATSSLQDGVQFSAPVFGPTGAVELSAGVAFAGPDLDLATVAAAPQRLLATTAEITAAIGGRRPD
jgi:hypothetical protein